jgi:hypothetical protein
MGYTWRKDGSSFNPGKLDYVFYSDATIDTGKYYILNTLAMDDIALDDYELQWDDTQIASDHLPIVFDINIENSVGINQEHHMPESPLLFPNYPNPFNSNTNITYYLARSSIVSLSIIDIAGTTVKRLTHDKKPMGQHLINWDGKNKKGEMVTSGLYFYVLETMDISLKKKMILIK